jgi:asparagine synthase (glutamine-hydrolysing)
MCGIAGYISDSHRMDKDAFIFFLDSMTHRGPDGFGHVSLNEGSVLLGHRRLAILDPSEDGRQPMTFSDGRLTITFNGEIYNFLELRKELQTFGYSFTTETDTEVILAAYSHWGIDCQYKFNGMWAFGIWDKREKQIFLSRDRFGVKPCFYLHRDGYFIFASELKAFMRLPHSIRPEIDGGMICLGQTIEAASKTILQNVRNLNAGHQIIYRIGKEVEIKRWWRTSSHLVEIPRTYPEQVEKFQNIFLDSCKIRMRSDVPIGTALSGGLDSSSVICGMSHIQNQHSGCSRQVRDWRKAFVLDYLGTSHSERKYAELVIQHVFADPTFYDINLDYIDPNDLVSMIVDFEGVQQPALGPWYIYSEMRRKGISVSIDGHGGDELLGGYFHYIQPAMLDAAFRVFDFNRWHDLQSIHSGLYQDPDRPDGLISVKAPSRIGVLANEWLIKTKELSYSVFPTGGKIRKFIKKQKKYLLNRGTVDFWRVRPADPELLDVEFISGEDRLNRALYFDFHFGMLPNILRNFDRLSMAHGVEIRAPFLDWRLVTYCFSLPSSAKLGGGFTKRILRDAMKGLMPESIRTRKSKIGFASPMRKWLAGPLKPFVLDYIRSLSLINSDFFDGRLLSSEIERYYAQSDYKTIEYLWPIIQSSILVKELTKSSRLL